MWISDWNTQCYIWSNLDVEKFAWNEEVDCLSLSETIVDVSWVWGEKGIFSAERTMELKKKPAYREWKGLYVVPWRTAKCGKWCCRKRQEPKLARPSRFQDFIFILRIIRTYRILVSMHFDRLANDVHMARCCTVTLFSVLCDFPVALEFVLTSLAIVFCQLPKHHLHMVFDPDWLFHGSVHVGSSLSTWLGRVPMTH